MLTATGIYFVVIISTAPMGEETTLFPEAGRYAKKVYTCYIYNFSMINVSYIMITC